MVFNISTRAIYVIKENNRFYSSRFYILFCKNTFSMINLSDLIELLLCFLIAYFTKCQDILICSEYYFIKAKIKVNMSFSITASF